MGQVNKTVTIYEGIGKESKKPYSALRVEVGEYTKLIFPDKFEMRYLKEVLAKNEVLNPTEKQSAPSVIAPTVAEAIDDNSTFLNED